MICLQIASPGGSAPVDPHDQTHRVLNERTLTMPRRFGDTLSFRLSDADHMVLIAASANQDLKPAALARQIVAHHLSMQVSAMPEPRHRADAGQWRELLTELARHGNNLNQIAHALNAGEKLTDISVNVRAVVSRHDALLECVMEFLRPRRGSGRILPAERGHSAP